MNLGGGEVAHLDTGKNINVALKKLSGSDNASYSSANSNILSIEKANRLDESASYADIALENSEYPVYTWYDNGTIYYWSEASNIYMNEDSSCLFYNYNALTSIDISSWNTTNVIDISSVFYDCAALESIDVSNWNTSNVTDMGCMFYYCENLTSINVSNFNTSNVTDMVGMFSYCSNLTSIDVSNWNTSNVENMGGMFRSCSGLTTIYSNDDNFVTDKVTAGGNMFTSCSNLVGGNGTAVRMDKDDYTMAHIDTEDNPGYFTDINDKDDGGGLNPDPEPEEPTWDLIINNVDSNGSSLTGSIVTLKNNYDNQLIYFEYNENDDSYEVSDSETESSTTTLTDYHGSITIYGLTEGEFTLTYITVPDGYSLFKAPFTLSAVYNDSFTFSVEYGNYDLNYSYESSEDTLYLAVESYTGAGNLPPA